MKIVDLTHPISSKTPVYPGTSAVQIETFATVDKDGYREKMLHIASHVGTHMDAPAHMLAEGRFLDDFLVESFTGSALAVDVRQLTKPELSAQVLDNLPSVEFILFFTGWSQKWGTAEYFSNFPYPGIDLANALTKRGIKGVGIDTPSVDVVDSRDYPTHHILLNNEIVIIENLTNLAALPKQTFRLFALPLKITEADGAPVRAIAMVK